jgi:MFS transporter, OFA family, oxalate/formate antiporter
LESRIPGYEDEKTGHKSGFFYGYWIVLWGFLVLFTALGIQYSFGIFFTPLLTEFGWSRANTSLAISICQVAAGFMGVITGRLSDSYGPRLLIIGCGFFVGLSCILMYTTNSLWQLYLFGGIILGIGISGSYAPVLSSVSHWFVRRRGLMTGIVVAGIGLGTVSFPLLVNWILSISNWRVSYIVLGVIALVIIITASFFIKRDPSDMKMSAYGAGKAVGNNPAIKEERWTLKRAARTRRFWIMCVVYLFQGYFVTGIITHIVPHAISTGIDASAAASILSFLGIGGIGGRVVMSGTSDRMGVKSSLITNIAIMLLALIYLQMAHGIWMLCLFAGIFGFGYGGMVGLQALLAVEMFGLASVGTITGTMTFSVSAGGTIGPVISGYLYDIAGSYQMAFIIFAALAALGLVLAVALRPPARKGTA